MMSFPSKFEELSQLTITRPKLTIETIDQGVKHI